MITSGELTPKLKEASILIEEVFDIEIDLKKIIQEKEVDIILKQAADKIEELEHKISLLEDELEEEIENQCVMDRDIELISELALRNDINNAPNKTERIGEWHQSTIPIGKDHVAYLTFDDDAFQEMRNIWEKVSDKC